MLFVTISCEQRKTAIPNERAGILDGARLTSGTSLRVPT